MRPVLLMCLLMLPAGTCPANPPTSIDLSYDLPKQNLHVQAAHPTQDLEKNYVRLMVVSINGQEVLTKNYFRQDSYDTFSDDLELQAKPDDVIKVELFAQGGGSLAKELKVQKSTGE